MKMTKEEKRDRLYSILSTIRDNESSDYLYELAEEALEILDEEIQNEND